MTGRKQRDHSERRPVEGNWTSLQSPFKNRRPPQMMESSQRPHLSDDSKTDKNKHSFFVLLTLPINDASSNCKLCGW